MKRLIIIALIVIGCSDEQVSPEPDSFCLFRKPSVSTNAGQLGQRNYEFVRCDPNPFYQISDLNRYIGYSTTDCDCTKQP